MLYNTYTAIQVVVLYIDYVILIVKLKYLVRRVVNNNRVYVLWIVAHDNASLPARTRIILMLDASIACLNVV